MCKDWLLLLPTPMLSYNAFLAKLFVAHKMSSPELGTEMEQMTLTSF